jgi:hypothetical protein
MRITARVFWIVGLVVPAIALMAALVWAEEASQAGTIRGVVQNADGPLSGAHVRVYLTENMVVADDDGAFELSIPDASQPVTVTAWVPGHYIGVTYGAEVGDSVVITMKPHYTTDNVEYDWFEFDGVKGSEACGLCHLGLDQWQMDAHGQAAVNPRFLTLYQGTDVHGNKSPKTEMDYLGNVLPRDPDAPYYGPGFKLDYPERAGNCASCHTPAAAKIDNTTNCGWSGCHMSITAQNSEEVPDGVSPLYLTGHAAEGISCEFCHKIADVILNEETQLPFPDMPGIMSYKLLRPVEGEELFFGTFDDVPRRNTYLPLQQESAFCAGCHHGVFGGVVGAGEVKGGVVIYNSYGEWLDSPYSDPETGQTCQDCHMPLIDEEYFVFPERGGTRRPGRIHTHLMPGASDENLLQNSATMTATAAIDDGRLIVDVAIINDQTGHHLPTGVPLRQMLLVVEASGAQGELLPLAEGPTLPKWAGNYAGGAGKIFEKLLQDEWTGEMPTAAYWRPVTIVSDTRLPAMVTDETAYVFDIGDGEAASVDVQLIFRRAFQELSEQKGWNDPDILMEQALIDVGAED